MIDAVNAARQFVGGSIAPGVLVMAKALHEHTSLLPFVKLRGPETLLGRNTDEAILSGIVNGTAAMVEGMIARMSAEIGRDAVPTVIVTGGFAKMVGSSLRAAYVHEENLILDGLRMLADRGQ